MTEMPSTTDMQATTGTHSITPPSPKGRSPNRLRAFLQNLFQINPIVVKEVRSRMRGPRAFITLTVILLVMGGLMYAMLQIILASSRYTSVLSPQVGQALFATLAFMELFMISAITPAVTAGAISGEKEKQTYEMLMSTPLSPTSILWGKLISALSYIFLLLFAGIPLASVVFIFGGVALGDMVKALLVLIMFAVVFGILGLFMSALFGRTGRATVASFITLVFLMVGPLFLAALISVLRQGEPPRWVLAPSPISTLSAALASSMGRNDFGGLFYALGGIFDMGISPISQTSIPRPLYHYSIPFYTLLSLILYMLSTRLIQATHRWRIRRKQLVLGIGSLVLLLAVIVGGFLITAPRYEWAVRPQGDNNQVIPERVIAAPAVAGGSMVQKEVQVAPALESTPTPVEPPTGVPTPTLWAENPVIQEVADEEVQAEIYAAVARQMFTVDHTFGDNAPGWQNLYLLSVTDDLSGDPMAVKGEQVTLSEGTRAGITKRLNDLPVKASWIETRDQAPVNQQNGAVEDGKGVIFTFGNIHVQNDGTVQVPASLYFASLGAGGKTYILSKVNGAWQITGTTGVEWIS